MSNLVKQHLGKIALTVMALLLCAGQFHVLHEKLLSHSHAPFQHHHHEHDGHPHEHDQSVPSSDCADCHEFLLTARSSSSTAGVSPLIGGYLALAFAVLFVAPRVAYFERIPDPPDIPRGGSGLGLIASLSIAPNSPPVLTL